MRLKKIAVTIIMLGVSVLALSLLLGAPVASAQDSDCLFTADLGPLGKIGCDEEDVVSFKDFRGELTAPEGTGLDPTLTRSSDAREFVVNTVNFVLTFLGLLAFVIVLYGGFLYVSAAGNEEQTGKGKKAITYAAIGIVIIIGSFALVNTLITSVGRPDSEIRGGEEGGSGSGFRGSSEEGSNIGQQAIYNLGAAEINASMRDFVAAYRNLASINSFLKKLNAVPAPRSKAENSAYVGEISNLMNQIKNQSNPFSETRQVVQAFIDDYLFNLQNLAPQDLENDRYKVTENDREDQADNYSDPALGAKILEKLKTEDEKVKKAVAQQEARQKTLERYKEAVELAAQKERDASTAMMQLAANRPSSDPQVEAARQRVKQAEQEAVNATAAFEAAEEDLEDAQEELDNTISSRLKVEIITLLSTRYNIFEANKRDFIGAIDEVIGDSGSALEARPSDQRDVKGKLPLVWKIMGPVADSISAQSAGSQALERGLVSEKDLTRAFAGIDPNVTVGDLFKDAIAKIHEARGLTDRPEEAKLLLEAVKSLERLYIIVKDIKFVFVRIKASSNDGNAPIIVEINGLDSRDPAGRTIPEDKYRWDPDGDGQDGISRDTGVTCGDRRTESINGPTITCMYTRPGTYRVRLSIESSDPTHIAGGQAYYSITVKPSVARIALKAQVGQVTTDIRKYDVDQNGKLHLIVDRTEFQVTTREATGSGGVLYDASESRGGGSANEQLANYKWEFGHPEAQVIQGPDKSKIEKHTYLKEGRYPLTLEVTDIGNRKDRKVVNVIVASIAARFTSNKDTAEPDEIIELDGSISRSDHGRINEYSWQIFDKNNNDVLKSSKDVTVIGATDAPTLRVKFKNPGTYLVKLKVGDGVKTAETDTEYIKIKSRKPRVNFSAALCPENCPVPSKPSVVDFDASLTFDPDPKDELTYNWQFFNELGEELKVPINISYLDAATNQSTTVALPSKTAKKIRVMFPRVGKYKARLTVHDSHTDLDVRQEDSKEKEVKIESVVEVTLTTDKKVVKLQNNAAAFVFKGEVRNAQSVKVDFGDGQTCENEITLNNGRGTFECAHSYDSAGSYIVTVTATSEEEQGEQSTRVRVHVSAGDTPLAVLEVSIDEVPFVQEEDGAQTNPIEVIRKKVITFDARNSVNSSGGSSGLTFSWDFGDGSRASGSQAKHSFEEISEEDKPYVVTLTVLEEQLGKPAAQIPAGGGFVTNVPEVPTVRKSHQAKFYVKVVSKKPQVATLSLEKKTQGQVTPVEVEVTAEGAVDPDGRITNYQFWYYVESERERKLSVVDTQSNRATLTVETHGEADQENEFIFCVSATDNNNNTAECTELFDEDELPKLKLKNGPNNSPLAEFTVDRTLVRIGEPVNFTSSSRDSDGTIKEYLWDLEGDGFQNDNASDQATIMHRYEKKSPRDGYRVKLKVIDDKKAAGYSKEIKVVVDPKSKPPQARFSCRQDPTVPSGRQIQCFDESTADKDAGAKIEKYSWDFDTSREYGCSTNQAAKPAHCNGDAADDEESTAKNPLYEYEEGGTHQIQLIVEDSDGNLSEPFPSIVTLVRPAAPNPAQPNAGTGAPNVGQPQSGAAAPRALLDSYPKFKFETIAGRQRKVIRFPARPDGKPSSNGEEITLFYGDSTGTGLSHKIDKNIWCDSRGRDNREDDADGRRDNDIDNPDQTAGGSAPAGTCTDPQTGIVATHCWKTSYSPYGRTQPSEEPRGPGHFRSRLTVQDGQGRSSVDEVDVIFGGSIDSADVSPSCEFRADSLLTGSLKNINKPLSVTLGALAGVLIALAAYGVSGFMRRGKTRN